MESPKSLAPELPPTSSLTGPAVAAPAMRGSASTWSPIPVFGGSINGGYPQFCKGLMGLMMANDG